MNDQSVRVEYRNATSDGPVLHFSIPSPSLLADLIKMFRRLSEGPTTLKASDLPLFHLKNLRDVELVCIGNQKEPSRRLQPDKTRELFRWIHDSEGWIWCAELAEGLTHPGHQYFDYGENNDVGIEASFMEESTSFDDGPAI